ncbi:MAG: 2-dehydro-3-deoxygalactonokinase [Candidatus Brocadiia bacterium]
MSFLSCDWGSTSFRLRLIANGEIVEERTRNAGATTITADLQPETPESRRQAFSTVLKSEISKLQSSTQARLPDVPIVISGMATSAHGWKELPYAGTPLGLDGSDLISSQETFHDEQDNRHPLFLISGVRTKDDVMRGEECEIIGLMNADRWRHYTSSCRIVMPGTHSKHVRIRDNCLTGFCTYMTGELFDLLSRRSVLAKTVDTDGSEVVADEAFRDGVSRSATAGLVTSLFRTRTNGLFNRLSPDQNANFLSGLLIGEELKHLHEAADTETVLLCAPQPLSSLYETAADELDVPSLHIVPPSQVRTLSVRGHRSFLNSVGREE